MKQSVSFVDNNTDITLFTEREQLSIPRKGELVEIDGQWYKVRQVYYTYHRLQKKDEVFCLAEVNLERSEFE